MPETPGGSSGAPQQGPAVSDVRAGYLTPQQQAERQAQDAKMDQGMNMSARATLKKRQEEDAAVNAAASGGGFKMDVAAMKYYLPKWQSVADRLKALASRGERFKLLDQPAEDEGSTMQKKAADAHADAYQAGVISQRNYAQAYADALRKAIESTERQEQAELDAVRQHGRER